MPTLGATETTLAKEVTDGCSDGLLETPSAGKVDAGASVGTEAVEVCTKGSTTAGLLALLMTAVGGTNTAATTGWDCGDDCLAITGCTLAAVGAGHGGMSEGELWDTSFPWTAFSNGARGEPERTKAAIARVEVTAGRVAGRVVGTVDGRGAMVVDRVDGRLDVVEKEVREERAAAGRVERAVGTVVGSVRAVGRAEVVGREERAARVEGRAGRAEVVGRDGRAVGRLEEMAVEGRRC